MNFAQPTDADPLAEVDMSSYGGGADVEPIYFTHASQLSGDPRRFGTPIDSTKSIVHTSRHLVEEVLWRWRS